MSRVLGSSQRLILQALHDLEAWSIVDAAYERSGALKDKRRRREERSAAVQAHFRKLADDGDRDAKLYLALGNSLRRTRRSARQKRHVPWFAETSLNPSRALALLARRGLVVRSAIQGGGAADLTPAGWSIAAALSVGIRFSPDASTSTPSPAVQEQKPQELRP